MIWGRKKIRMDFDFVVFRKKFRVWFLIGNVEKIKELVKRDFIW